MKKVIFGGLMLASVGIGFVSCKKESSESNQQSYVKQQEGIYSDGKLLVFKTYQDFESVVQMPTPEVEKDFLKKVGSMDHTTYSKSKQLSKSDIDLVGDEFLAQILNEDLAVQIGSWIYRINKPTEKVYALSVRNADDYPDLIAEKISNTNVLEYSTEEDVIEILEPGADLGEKAFRNCQKSQQDVVGWDLYADWIDENNIYLGGYDKRYKFQRKMKVKYDQWGIYRKLFGEFEHKENFGGTWDETHFSMQVYGTYSVRNAGGGNFGIYPSINPYFNPSYLSNTNTNWYDFEDDKKEIVAYRGTRCLDAFELRGWTWFRNKATRLPNLVPNDGSGVYIISN